MSCRLSYSSCPLSNSVKKITVSKLKRAGRVLVDDSKGQLHLDMCSPVHADINNLVMLEQAWSKGLMQLTPEGNVELCGEVFSVEWDLNKIRHKIEQALRQMKSPGEMIRIAACLGVEIL